MRSFSQRCKLRQQSAPPSVARTYPSDPHHVPEPDPDEAASLAIFGPQSSRSTRGIDPPYDQSRYQDEAKQVPQSKPVRISHTNYTPCNPVAISLNGTLHDFSPVLLRDMCTCPLCVDQSTRQKLFSTVEIPADIKATVVPRHAQGVVDIRWSQDVPLGDADHITTLSLETLRKLVHVGSSAVQPQLPSRVLWHVDRFRQDVQDLDYEAYMSDDSALHTALQILHTHGLLFLTDVPESENSVSAIAERIGPVKNTFYGYTWDVRSVPQAKNVAYTSQDLGFHMDLLYMKQPPHLQFLHCIRSSSEGGASLFTDSHKAAQDLFVEDVEAFKSLIFHPVDFHYDHIETQYYHQHRKVIELSDPLVFGGQRTISFGGLLHRATQEQNLTRRDVDITKWIDAISWSPPFQAPFSIPAADDPSGVPSRDTAPVNNLNLYVDQWHAAASKFNQLIHSPEAIYERLMKPGECVLFDNRRVLHARKAFDVADAGKERWLRGAYLDKDPYLSKLRILQERFGSMRESPAGDQGMFERLAEDLLP